MLKTTLCNIELKNPIIMASGTFGFGREYDNFYDIGILGGVSTKGLTLEARQGNDSPRVAETYMGMLNSVGLQNPGVDYFLQHELPFLKQKGVTVIANLCGSSKSDYMKIAAKVSKSDVDMVELNISCPNVSEGGIAFGQNPRTVLDITRAVKSVCSKPLMVKLSPNVTDIVEIALAAQNGGADAVSLINTLGGMAVDVKTRKPILARVFGGLSGPAIKPIALKMTYQVAKKLSIPVVGMGGISSAQDILEFLMCGASAIMVGTYNFINPYAGQTLLNDLTKLMQEYKIDSISQIIGTLEA